MLGGSLGVASSTGGPLAAGLGLVQTASENKRVIGTFLREVGERGFPLDPPPLVVLDGAKGLRAAVAGHVSGERTCFACETRTASS